MTSAPSPPGGHHRLQVESAGATRTFDGDRVVIGREADCDVVVLEPSASRHHAVLQREGDTLGRRRHQQQRHVRAWPTDHPAGRTDEPAEPAPRRPRGRSGGRQPGPGDRAAAVPSGGRTAGAVPTSAEPGAGRRVVAQPAAAPAAGRGGARGRVAAAAGRPARSAPAQLLGGAAAAGRGGAGPHHRPRAGQRRRARRRAGEPATRGAGPRRPQPARGAARPRELQRHLRQRAPGAGERCSSRSAPR